MLRIVRQVLEKFVGHQNDSMLTSLPSIRGSRLPNDAITVRETLKSYVNSMEGWLPLQWDYVRSRGKTKQNEQ